MWSFPGETKSPRCASVTASFEVFDWIRGYGQYAGGGFLASVVSLPLKENGVRRKKLQICLYNIVSQNNTDMF